jgi:hypothetical protein
LKLIEGSFGRGKTSDRHYPESFFDTVLVQPEYFPDSSSHLISGNGISKALGGNDPDSGRLLGIPHQYRQYQVLPGPGFTRCLDQSEL